MRKNLLLVLAVVGVLLIASMIANCGKEKNLGPELLEKFNKNILGVRINADAANMTTEPQGDNYLVTIKSPEATFDTSVYKEMSFGQHFKPMTVPFKLEEIQFIYNPDDNYLETASMKGLNVKWDPTEMMELKEKPTMGQGPFMNLQFNLGIMNFKNYDISPMITYQGTDIFELIGLLMKSTKTHETEGTDFVYNVAFTTDEKEKVNFSFKADKVNGRQKSISDIFITIYKKGEGVPDVAQLLKSGEALMDVSASLDGMSVEVFLDGKKKGGGVMDHASFDYFLKPNKEKTHFEYGFNWMTKGMKLTLPEENKKYEVLGTLSEMNMKMTLGHLSSDLIKSYFNMTKKNMEMSVGGTGDAEKLKAQKGAMAMQMMGQVAQSQPTFGLSIAPLKHHLGELTAQADFALPSMTTPAGKAVVTVMNIEDLIAKVKEAGFVPEDQFEKTVKWIKSMFVVDDSGKGVLTLEMKQDKPGAMFLNGNPVKM